MIAAQMNPAAMTREDPGKWGALALTALIHGALVLLLFFGVQWQRRPPEPVQVQIVRSLPPLPAPEQQVAEPPPQPKPQPRPKEVEPPHVKKPDIALPKEPEKPIKKEKPQVEPPKPPEKPPQKVPPKPEKPVEAVKPQLSARELEAQRQRDLLMMESDKTRRQVMAQANASSKAERDSATARFNSKAEAEWIDTIRQKVRGNLSAPPFPGNPEAVFAIELFPTGEVGTIQLQRSSGIKALDEAMYRAIKNSSPLPMPSRPDVFQRNLIFVFKPRSD